MIWLVWMGTVLYTLGGLIAYRRRALEYATETDPEPEPEPSPAAQKRKRKRKPQTARVHVSVA